MPYSVAYFVNCFLWKRTSVVLHQLLTDCGGSRFHFWKYLSNQRQRKVNFRTQSVNQGCLNLTSVPSAEQRWFNEIEAWKCRLKWGEIVRENIILVCVQLNKLPGCKIGHSTDFPSIYYSCISQNWKNSSLVSLSTVPDDLQTILAPRPTETRPRGLSIDPPGRNSSQNKNRTQGKFIVLSIYLLDTCER